MSHVCLFLLAALNISVKNALFRQMIKQIRNKCKNADFQLKISGIFLSLKYQLSSCFYCNFLFVGNLLNIIPSSNFYQNLRPFSPQIKSKHARLPLNIGAVVRKFPKPITHHPIRKSRRQVNKHVQRFVVVVVVFQLLKSTGVVVSVSVPLLMGIPLSFYFHCFVAHKL